MAPLLAEEAPPSAAGPGQSEWDATPSRASKSGGAWGVTAPQGTGVGPAKGKVVRSLEQEDWQRLGAPVFVRGQLRSYARLLNVNLEPLLQQALALVRTLATVLLHAPEQLRDLGVKTVVVLPSWAVGTPWQDAANLPIESLGITREVRDDAVVFRL